MICFKPALGPLTTCTSMDRTLSGFARDTVNVALGREAVAGFLEPVDRTARGLSIAIAAIGRPC